ncbi:MAG: WD40 repeat domain-containing protein [Nostocaceae cyanobacterium]|nr:WD40 repeat domain-containing protein [Nostocaceae cyanobacterium]
MWDLKTKEKIFTTHRHSDWFWHIALSLDGQSFLNAVDGEFFELWDIQVEGIIFYVEAIIEMAIASFLDTEALGFADCKPGRGQ